MYGWILGGFSSLFEPITGQNPTEWPGKGSVSAEVPTRPGVKTAAWRQESHCRPAKRNYQSVHVAESVCQSEQVEVKRRKRDVVISFMKKTVARVAGLLRLRKSLTRCEKPRSHEETQVSAPSVLQTHTFGIVCYSVSDGTTLPVGLPDRAKDRERRGSLQLLSSRPVLRVGNANPEPTCNGFGHNRCYKPSLTVEEAIKQNNKEHYRRLLEMVTEKYSKSQPLPFNQSKPQDLFTWRNASAANDRLVRCYFYLNDCKHPADLDLSTEVATRLNLVDRDTPAVGLPDTHSAHTRHSEEDIPRLTKEMAAEVSGALAQSDPNRVLSAAFKLRITQRDLGTLQEGSWLNDEVMNFYLSLIMERSSGEAGRLKVYSFSTFFFPKLRGGGGGQAGGHAAVKRWTKAVDLFTFDLILVPLHLGVHWALAVIDFRSKTVKSYDSMGRRHDDISSLLLLYLIEEHKAKKGRELDCTKWTVGSLKASEIPQQKNGSDCGVFACKYADYIARGQPLTFKQCHMPLFRKLMIWEILHQKLL
uniref:Ubiquitin-like protease family profile domain-containing protein n=1 Tax=Astatotilapia calliptera TaxID=8154 RepID=A0AAX7TSP0_ASTCA